SLTRVSGHRKAEHELRLNREDSNLPAHSYRVVCFETLWLTISSNVEVFFDIPNVDVLDGGYLDLTLASPMLKI
ncbi:hypothetical protein Tco_0591623, partial [Tanacetum coccineum]